MDMMTDYEKDLVTRPWKAFVKSRPTYFTYMELVKAVIHNQISLDTKVTRRDNDDSGVPIGELKEFTPTYYLHLKSKISPSHTPDSKVRSFFRIEKTKEVFLRFEDKSRLCFLLFSFGAGGAGFKSKEPIDNEKFREKSILLTIPNFTIYGEENFHAAGHILAGKKNDKDYEYFFIFDYLDDRKKVEVNKNCFFLKHLKLKDKK